MTLRAIPQSLPTAQMNAANGTPATVNLTTIAGGGAQNGYIASTDLQIVTTADATNKAITIPDPNKYGGALADSWLILNGQSGQTLNVYPPTGGNIDGAGANTAVTCAQGASLTIYLVSYTASSSVWIADGGT